MNFLQKQIISLKHLLSPHHYRSWFFSAAYGIAIIGSFYGLRWIFPETVQNANVIISIVFIILSVLLLFPLREIIAKYFFTRLDFITFFGRDFHHLDFIARQFTMEALLKEIVPELIEWLRVTSGEIAILEPERKSYKIRKVSNGKLRRTSECKSDSIEEIRKFSLKHGSALYFNDFELPPEIRETLKEMQAAVFQPIIYRKRFLGFLLLHEEPRNKYASIGLETFAGKAAVSIQNYILATRLIDSHLFEKEMEAAGKIQNRLLMTKIPNLPGYEIEQLKPGNFPGIIEFCQIKSDTWFMALICASKQTGASSILLFGVLGYLYSYLHMNETFNMHKLMNHLKKDPDLNRSQYRMDILLAEINSKRRSIKFMIDGNKLRVRRMTKSGSQNDPLMGKNHLLLSPEIPITISYGTDDLLKMRVVIGNNVSFLNDAHRKNIQASVTGPVRSSMQK